MKGKKHNSAWYSELKPHLLRQSARNRGKLSTAHERHKAFRITYNAKHTPVLATDSYY